MSPLKGSISEALPIPTELTSKLSNCNLDSLKLQVSTFMDQSIQLQALSKAFGSLPHIGGVLSAVILIGATIHNELKNLDATLVAERELGEEASYVIRDIVMYGKNLKTNDEVHLAKIAKQMKKVENAARGIEKHIVTASRARARHIRNYGRKLADLYECTFENATVASLKKQISEARSELLSEFMWMKMMEGEGVVEEEQPLEVSFMPSEMNCIDEIFSKTKDDASSVRWVKREELDGDIDLFKNMVPSGPVEDSEDGRSWFIARVPYIGGKQPGKYRPGMGAYFGFEGESHTVIDMNFEVLVAKPNSVRWVKMSGTFSEERLRPVRPIKGCHEDDGTELVIARAWAREHMRTGLLTQMTLQPGKASPKLEGAYVTAGKRERKVQDYEVLVYA